MKNIYTLFFVLFVATSFAQTQKNDTIKIDEIIIDASKNNTKLQSIPIAASAISAKKIEFLKLDNLTKLNGFVPNLFMPEHGTRLNTYIYVRGIGVSKGEPSVGVYVDDIPYFDNGSVNFELFDIKKIEVLRGPQGTLYGRNTMGGLIKVYTDDPVWKHKGSFKIDYGNYNQIKAIAGYNLPITSKLALVSNVAYTHKDGFFTNSFDQSNVDQLDTYAGRLKGKYKISDKANLKFLLNYEKSNQYGFPYALFDTENQQTGDINYNDPGKYDRDFFSTGFYFNYKAHLFDVSISASYQQLKDDYALDQDFTAQPIYFVDMIRNNKSGVQELNIKSKRNAKIKWIAGLFSFQRNLPKNVIADITTPSYTMTLIKDYDQNISGGAMFGQIDYPIGKFMLSSGIRYDMESSRMAYNYDLEMHEHITHKEDFVHHLNFTQVLPKFSISYAPTDNIMTYTSATKGYKAGGFNATIERAEDETFEPEYSWNYEAGIKTSFFDRKLTANLDIFYIDWKSQQVIQSVPSGRGVMTKNAGKSESKGIEFESSYQVNENLNFGLAFGYTNATFLDYKKNNTTDYSLNKLPLVPEYTAGFATNYNYYLQKFGIKSLTFHADYKYFGKFYWDVDNLAYQNPYTLFNANITANMKNISLGIWGKNLTNTSYNRYYFNVASIQKSFAEPAQPLQFGVFVKTKF